MTVVDDTVLRVGSSNFNNRSLRLDTECDIVIGNDASLSGKHAVIICRDGPLQIRDNDSTNGTYVNGKRISSPQVLKDADKTETEAA